MDYHQPPQAATTITSNNTTSKIGHQHHQHHHHHNPTAFVCRSQNGRRCANNKPDNKRSRTSFSQHQLSLLEEAFKQTSYPNQMYRDQLAASIDLDPARVQVWFQNRRAKLKKQLGKQSGGYHQHQHHQHHQARPNCPPSMNHKLQLVYRPQAVASNLMLLNSNKQRQQAESVSGSETALDLHLSNQNTVSSLSSRSSSSDDLYQDAQPATYCSCPTSSNSVAKVQSPLLPTIGDVYYGPQVSCYSELYQQAGGQRRMHQIYLAPSAQQHQLLSNNQQEQQPAAAASDEVSEFSRMLNSELGRALYCATNQQRQQHHHHHHNHNNQFYQQQQAATNFHLDLQQQQQQSQSGNQYHQQANY